MPLTCAFDIQANIRQALSLLAETSPGAADEVEPRLQYVAQRWADLSAALNRRTADFRCCSVALKRQQARDAVHARIIEKVKGSWFRDIVLAHRYFIDKSDSLLSILHNSPFYGDLELVSQPLSFYHEWCSSVSLLSSPFCRQESCSSAKRSVLIQSPKFP